VHRALFASFFSPVFPTPAAGKPQGSFIASVKGKCRGGLSMDESSPDQFQLCFRSLFRSGRGFAFPCDGGGHVDLDHLSDRARVNYLFARAMVGRELSMPAVERTA
jgi:hypothetical protein